MAKRIGYGFLTFMFFSWAIVSFIVAIPMLLTDFRSAIFGIIFGLVSGVFAYVCFRKTFGFSKKAIAESRKYIPGEPLPISPCPGLILSSGEVCHIFECARIGKIGTVTTGSGRRNVLNTNPGNFYITNKRIVATSPKYSFDKPFKSLSAYTLYTDGFSLQFGGTTFTIIIKDPTYILTILKVAIES